MSKEEDFFTTLTNIGVTKEQNRYATALADSVPDAVDKIFVFENKTDKAKFYVVAQDQRDASKFLQERNVDGNLDAKSPISANPTAEMEVKQLTLAELKNFDPSKSIAPPAKAPPEDAPTTAVHTAEVTAPHQDDLKKWSPDTALVREAQARLHEIGEYDYGSTKEPDGQFGSRVEAGIKHFQKEIGLTDKHGKASGVIGKQTDAALRERALTEELHRMAEGGLNKEEIGKLINDAKELEAALGKLPHEAANAVMIEGKHMLKTSEKYDGVKELSAPLHAVSEALTNAQKQHGK